MTIIYILVVISMMATVAPAAVKRDDFPAGSSAVSGQSAATGSSGTSSPVYSPPSGSMGSTYSGSGSAITYSQSYNPGSLPSGTASTNQYADHSAAGSNNNYQSSPNSQGNLYYYYYPVQDKPKETGYQASASSQYASAVTPNADGSTQHIDSNGQNQASSPSDLSYSAQDLSYSAQAMNPGMSEYSGSAQASANYDQTLSSLASQLQQQYGYATQGNNAPSYASSSSQQQPSYTQSYTYDPSQQQHQASQMEQAGQYSASNPIPNYGIAGQQAQFIPAQQAQQLAGFNPAAAQAAAQSMYAQYPGAGGLHFGNFAAGSGPASSFEPAASGYRRYGIGSFIMPMLALAGLSLLIPTVTSLTASGRKKRSIDGESGAKESVYGDYFDRMERYYSIYKTAVEKEECLNRIICELGDAMSGVKGKSTLFS